MRQAWTQSSAISRWSITATWNKLVAWARFNGLLTSRTRLFIKGNEVVDLAKLQEMVADVSHHFRAASACPNA